MSRAVEIPEGLLVALEQIGAATGQSVEELVQRSLSDFIVSKQNSFQSQNAAVNSTVRSDREEADNSAEKPTHSGLLYISEPIIDLVKGLLHGTVTVGHVLKHGGFGLGTLNLLDGEVVVLDGTAYQQRADGTCRAVPDDAMTPFMMVTDHDEAATEIRHIENLGWASLQDSLASMLPSENLFASIKIEGEFEYMKLRAVRKQCCDRPLVEVTREQAVFEFRNTHGSLIGFYTPPFLGHALSVPGFHLHFISKDLGKGGHVLDIQLKDATVSIQPLYSTIQGFPKTVDFANAKLTGDVKSELEEAEN